jgi:hypothetical protein
LRLARFEFFQLQLQLFDLAVQLFGRKAKLHAAQLGDQQLQVLDPGLAGEGARF